MFLTLFFLKETPPLLRVGFFIHKINEWALNNGVLRFSLDSLTYNEAANFGMVKETGVPRENIPSASDISHSCICLARDSNSL